MNEIMGYTSEGQLMKYKWTEEEVNEFAPLFLEDIFFVLTDLEFSEYITEIPQDNLKSDFIYFNPKLEGMSQMVCTCGKFDEWSVNHDRLAKMAVKHARKTGHVLNPRGN